MVAADADYRRSHLHKGEEYEQWLSQRGFESYMHALEARILTGVVERLNGSTPIERVLDFACGTGRITSVLEPLCKDLIAIDVSESMVSQARGKCGRTRFIVEDITIRPPQLAPRDLITAFRFFGNADRSLRRGVLAALNRLLAPGGHLIIDNHRNPDSLYNRIRRVRGEQPEGTLDYGTLLALLNEHGFQVAAAYGVGIWFVHDRLDSPRLCESRWLQLIEPLSRAPGMYRVCPDGVLVARKVASVNEP